MKIFSTYLFSVFLFPVFFAIPSGNHVNSSTPGFPVPKTDKLLFYLQRTINANTIIYEINTDNKGEISIQEPIRIKWITYSGDSSYEDLSYIQRNFAYGLDVTLIDPVKKSFMFNFVSYKQKKLYLLKSAIDNKYHAYIQINNKLSILEKIFVQVEGGSFWLPEIRYVEITGTHPGTVEKVSEKIKP